jgi:RNA polymerase sigma factor (sigma-70 family)
LFSGAPIEATLPNGDLPVSSTEVALGTTAVNGRVYPEQVPEDLLDLYFGDMGSIELLTAEQEVDLAKLIEAGNKAANLLKKSKKELDETNMRALQKEVTLGQKARDHFIGANLRLVVSVASKFTKKSNLELAELLQEGNLGLIRAVEKFDWRRGYKFSTYATWWIRQAIQRGIAEKKRAIRLPVAKHDALRKIYAARVRLESETGRAPSIEELAEATNLTTDNVCEALNADSVSSTTSLDRPVSHDQDTGRFGDFIPDKTEDVEQAVLVIMQRKEVKKMLATLPERERTIIELRYGILDGEPRTREDIGRHFGLTGERIRQLESRALDKLRRPRISILLNEGKPKKVEEGIEARGSAASTVSQSFIQAVEKYARRTFDR